MTLEGRYLLESLGQEPNRAFFVIDILADGTVERLTPGQSRAWCEGFLAAAPNRGIQVVVDAAVKWARTTTVPSLRAVDRDLAEAVAQLMGPRLH